MCARSCGCDRRSPSRPPPPPAPAPPPPASPHATCLPTDPTVAADQANSPASDTATTSSRKTVCAGRDSGF
eukprot:5405514-Pyramimonas_sp.AAC.1